MPFAEPSEGRRFSESVFPITVEVTLPLAFSSDHALQRMGEQTTQQHYSAHDAPRIMTNPRKELLEIGELGYDAQS